MREKSSSRGSGARLAAACAAALLCALILVPRSFADEATGNEVGATFTVDTDSGKLTCQVTTAAVGTSQPGAATLKDGTAYTGSSLEVDTVSQTVEEEGVSSTYEYAVTAVGEGAFKGNTTLESLSFKGDLLGQTTVSYAIRDSAFKDCTALESVEFPEKVAGIGPYAFSGCSSLQNIEFPGDKDAELYYAREFPSPAIGLCAFEGCLSLKTVSLPAMTSGVRKGDVYHYGENTYYTGTSSTRYSMFTSASMPYWGGPGGPIVRPDIGAKAFSGCTALEYVVFKAGADQGMFTCWNEQSQVFLGCEALESLVFEDIQPYWADSNRSAKNGGASLNYWTSDSSSDVTCEIEAPTLYYAVDYYATADPSELESDDKKASKRLARVEYARGTSPSAIATSSADARAAAYPDAKAYREIDADGEVPDPRQAAGAAGLDSSKFWVWRLTDTQSHRSGLTDSCSAYLAHADDISGGSLSASQIDALYAACDYNLSQDTDYGTAFDIERYCNPTKSYAYNPDNDTDTQADNYSVANASSAWFELYSAGESTLLPQIGLRRADGKELDWVDFEVSLQACDSSSGEFSDMSADDVNGPVLVTITPKAESSYSGVLREWLLVKRHEAAIGECYTTDTSTTYKSAIYNDGLKALAAESYTSPFAVGIGTQDPLGAVVGAAYAGLVDAPVNVLDTADAGYGFTIATKFRPDGIITGGRNRYANSYANAEDAAGYAVAVYRSLKSGMTDYTSKSYNWGNTAVLVVPDAINQVGPAAATYAYTMKAPVFFAEEDGTVSSDTQGCLDDFANVVVIGDEGVFSAAAFSSLKTQLGNGIEVSRIAGDAGSSASLSLAVARVLVAGGACDTMHLAIVTSGDTIDTVSALNYAGHEGSTVLAAPSSVDAKALYMYLHERRDDVGELRIFGRSAPVASNETSSSSSFSDELERVWTSSYATPSPAEGDTLELSSALFTLGSDGKALRHTSDLFAHKSIAAGSYSRNKWGFTLQAAQDAYAFDLSSATVKLATASYTYSGSAYKPAVSSLVLNGVSLRQGIDFSVSYSNNTNAGNASVNITGMGSYAGKVLGTFTIAKASNIITLPYTNYTRVAKLNAKRTISLQGKAKAGKVAYKSNSKYITVSSSGKVVIPKNFAGVAKITVSAAGTTNYAAAKSRVVIVNVVPAQMKVKKVTNLKTRKAKIEWTKMKGADKYKVQYRIKGSSKWKSAGTTKGSSKVVSKLIRGRTYYLRVCAYDAQTKTWGDWAASKSVKIRR